MLYAHRYHEELQGIVGMFVNALPLRFSDSNESVTSCMIHTQRFLSEALARAHVPMSWIVDALGTRRVNSISTLYQVSFQVNAVENQKLVEAQVVNEPTVKMDLEMRLFQGDDKVFGPLIYDSAIFAGFTIRGWIDDFQTLLCHSVESSDASFHECGLSFQDVQRKLCQYWRAHLRAGASIDLDTGEKPLPAVEFLP